MMSVISERPQSKGKEYVSAKHNKIQVSNDAQYALDPIQQVDQFLAELDYRNLP